MCLELTTVGFLPLIISSSERRDATTFADAPWRSAITTNRTLEAATLEARASIFQYKQAMGQGSFISGGFAGRAGFAQNKTTANLFHRIIL